MTHDPPPSSFQRFELEVRAETAGTPWRAVLTEPATATRLEFDSPLALLRWIAQRSLPPHGPGLR